MSVSLRIYREPPEAALPAGTDVIDDSLQVIEQLYDYNHWIFSLLRPHLGNEILEVGGGTGTITQFLSMAARRVLSVEPVPAFVERFQSRLGHMRHVAIQHAYLSDLPAPLAAGEAFDTVVSCNVLEHIEDDVHAVRCMAQHLRADGRVVIFVPAGPFACGRLDRALGHFRRYSLSSLRRTMEGAGLRWEAGHYSNFVGLLGWFTSSVVLRRQIVSPRQAMLFNKLVPILSALERWMWMPCGQSVLGVGRKVAERAIEPSLTYDAPLQRAA